MSEILALVGNSGFLGKYLSHHYPNAQKISLRREGWQGKVASSTIIINLVGKAHDHEGVTTKDDYFFVNLELTKRIFEVFKESPNTKVLVHISSLAAIEEFESSQPLTELDKCKPRSWYGQSKRAAEEWLLDQKLPCNKKVLIIRPPMVHGPGDKGNLGLLYKLISKGIPYPLSSFENNRSFISIDNFCFFIKQIVEKNNLMSNGIYHIADDESISTKEIINIIQKVTGRKTLNLSLPKGVARYIAKVGDIIPIPLNTIRLKKLTSDLLISNKKIKVALDIKKLPVTAKEGLEKTIRSFEVK